MVKFKSQLVKVGLHESVKNI